VINRKTELPNETLNERFLGSSVFCWLKHLHLIFNKPFFKMAKGKL